MSKKRPMSQCDRTTFSYAKGKKWVVRVDLSEKNAPVQYRRTTAAKFGRWYRAPFYSKDVFTAVEALHLVAYWKAEPDKFGADLFPGDHRGAVQGGPPPAN